jgi:hypothetical protein
LVYMGQLRGKQRGVRALQYLPGRSQQVLHRIDTSAVRRLDEGVRRLCPLGEAHRPAAIVVLAADGARAQV